MDLIVAENLIRQGVESKSRSSWADLGCGNGLFTIALGNLLKETQSTIYAVDMDEEVLQNLDIKAAGVHLTKLRIDFTKDLPSLPRLDGIIMANSLHFVKDKVNFLTQLISKLADRGCVIIVEYDTNTPNLWVPFPISRHTLIAHSKSLGLHCRVLAEHPSIYNNGNIYSAILT